MLRTPPGQFHRESLSYSKGRQEETKGEAPDLTVKITIMEVGLGGREETQSAQAT